MSHLDIPPEDFIRVDSYLPLCDHWFRGQVVPPGVIFVEPAEVHDFFRVHHDQPGPYVLVSAASDYGIAEQARSHPNADLVTSLAMLDWQGVANERRGYHKLTLGPACREDSCSPDDTYSVKIATFTRSTFDELPDNVACWLSSNLDVVHRLMGWLPFGLAHTNDCHAFIEKYRSTPKTKGLYVNFQANTLQRAQLLGVYRERKEGWLTVRVGADLPAEKYIAEMAEHRYVLCPAGNGLDCYRMYEALYLGCIPIVEDGVFGQYMKTAGLPVILNKDRLYNIDLPALTAASRLMGPTSLDSIRLSTVKARIDRARKEVFG